MTAFPAVCPFMLLPSFAHAQSDWGRVQALPANARLRIEVNNTILEGRFRSADDTKITLNRGSIARASVGKIALMRSRKADGFGKGFLIGFALGAGLSYANTGSGSWAGLTGLRFGTLGGLAGLTWGINNPKHELVYRR